MKLSHRINFIFPLTLFLVFALGAVTVTAFSARVYRSTVQRSARNDDARTSVLYVTEKLRRHDGAGSVEILPADGTDSEILVLSEEIDGKAYRTCLYLADGELREFYADADVAFSAAAGTAVMPLSAFSAEEMKPNLIRFACTDEDGRTASSLVSTRSEGAEGRAA